MEIDMLLLLLACTGTLCEGRAPAEADEVTIQLTVMGYIEADTARQVHSDADQWSDFLSSLSEDTGAVDDPIPDIDWEDQIVFTNSWVDGGCEEGPSYEAWQQDDQIRMRVAYGWDDGCDAYMPQIDVLVLDMGEASDLTWCE